jgi:endogenous inhibitor of DNA gyrase (YacG/DUF329 family)
VNECSRCALPMPPGAVHVSESGCIEALRHALDAATTCVECQTPVKVVCHPGCVHRLVGKRAVDLGLGAAERKVIEGVTDFLGGRKKSGEWQP